MTAVFPANVIVYVALFRQPDPSYGIDLLEKMKSVGAWMMEREDR